MELYPTPNFFRDKRRKDERFASVIGFLNADYYALNGCVQSEVNKKHAFEDTVEKKLPPSVIDLVNYPFRVINSNPCPRVVQHKNHRRMSNYKQV